MNAKTNINYFFENKDTLFIYLCLVRENVKKNIFFWKTNSIKFKYDLLKNHAITKQANCKQFGKLILIFVSERKRNQK